MSMYLRDLHQLPAAGKSGEPLPFLKKDALNFMADQKGAKLKATIRATYSGYLLNQRVYPGKHMRVQDCFGDWCSKEHGGTAPFDKPVLTHHDHHGEPIGRVVASKFVQLVADEILLKDYKSPAKEYAQGSGYIEVQGVITDADAIQKILDGRYNTVSAGMSADHAYCSLCGKDYRGEDACEHIPGEHYDVEDSGSKRLCYIITGKLKYHELSYVNVPASANAVTVAKELFDSDKKTEVLGVDQAQIYDGMFCMDEAGNEVNLLGTDGEKLPATKTQIQVCSDIDLDKLLEPAKVDLEDTEKLSDETFAIGNVVRSLAGSELLEDGPMSGMISFFKAITKKADGHQHILYLELNIEKRQLRGGTEFTDKGEHHWHSVDLPVDDLNATTFSGETRDADRGDHHVHGFEFDMMKDHCPQVALADALKAARMVDDHLRAGKLSRHQFLCLVPIQGDEEIIEGLVKGGLIDATLSAAQRKKLKASTFCGPNRSFPVPDCAHVTAARRLIGRAKLSEASKARVLACVNRKAKAMGCNSKDETNRDLYGMLTANEEHPMEKKPIETPAPEVKKTIRDEFKALKDEALLDKAVELDDSLKAKDRQIVSLTGEKDALTQKNASLEASSKQLTDENTGLREKLHVAKARELATMRLVTGALKVDSNEKFEEAVTELAKRTEDSLNDAIKDSAPAFQSALKERTPNPSGFLKEKGPEKPATELNGDGMNTDAQKPKTEKKEDPEARKAEKAKDL